MSKVDVMTGYVEMSRICSVPISYLVFRGIKLTSFVAKSVGKNTLMPDLEKSFDSRPTRVLLYYPEVFAVYG
jgi:hypothetical protein